VKVVPGAASSPVILHVPHASRRIPSVVRRGLLLSDGDLETELDHMTDAYTDRIASQAAASAGLRPWIAENELSRLVVDPERFLDEREEMRAVGMGAVYTRTSHGEPLRDDDPALVETYFHPYAQAMADLVADRLDATGRAVIVDVHSYPADALPYELHGDGPRPAVCLGTDAFHTPPDLVAAALESFAACAPELNTPFSGCYIPTAFYGTSAQVIGVMVEIKRRSPDGPPVAGLQPVVAALTDLIGRLTSISQGHL
jgi:N-formylglutamate deformylase